MDYKRFPGRVIILRNAKYRMTHFVEPLVEEPVHWLSGGLFNRDSKLARFHRLVRVLCQVMIDCAPPVVLAKIGAQHMQYGAPARISVGIEDRIRIGIVPGYDGPPLTAGPSLIIGLFIPSNIEVQEDNVSQAKQATA